MLTFQEFVAELARQLDLSAIAAATPTTDLYEELGLDSLQAYELVYVAEELAGAVSPDPLLGGSGEDPPFEPIATLGDVHDYYQRLYGR